jgi:hypothetical protein
MIKDGRAGGDGVASPHFLAQMIRRALTLEGFALLSRNRP